MRVMLLKCPLLVVTHGFHDLVQRSGVVVPSIQGKHLQVLAVRQIRVHVVCDGEQVHWVTSKSVTQEIPLIYVLLFDSVLNYLYLRL